MIEAGKLRRKGRPPKSAKGPSTSSIAMRVRPEIYDDIQRDAEQFGRSIAAQAERRVAYPQPGLNDIGRIVELVIRAVERRAGKPWNSDAQVRGQCRIATDFILEALLGAMPERKGKDALETVRLADEIFGEIAVNAQSDEEVFASVMSDE